MKHIYTARRGISRRCRRTVLEYCSCVRKETAFTGCSRVSRKQRQKAICRPLFKLIVLPKCHVRCWKMCHILHRGEPDAARAIAFHYRELVSVSEPHPSTNELSIAKYVTGSEASCVRPQVIRRAYGTADDTTTNVAIAALKVT